MKAKRKIHIRKLNEYFDEFTGVELFQPEIIFRKRQRLQKLTLLNVIIQ
jgi:hypothetical protein